MEASDFTEHKPGELIRILEGAWSFLPAPLPPPFSWTSELVGTLSAADRAIGRLAGVGAGHLGGINPHLLIRPFLRREAVLSSRIEGTQATLSDLLLFEQVETAEQDAPDVREVSNYVRALEYGLESLHNRPLGLPVIRELHHLLMTGVRGGDKTPGAFRDVQVFIGASARIEDARFVPPPPFHVQTAMEDLERYLQSPGDLPPLVRIALVHYQFEAVHPFQDGNGRIGRLLVSLMLCADRLLPLPLLYLSAFFERRRDEYYRRLLEVSTRGAWADWVAFFLRGVASEATDAVARAERLIALRAEYSARLQTARSSALTLKLVDSLFGDPAVTMPGAARLLQVTARSAQAAIDRLVRQGILREVTGRRRNRVWIAADVLNTLEAQERPPAEGPPAGRRE
jgi:Fic family protein